MNVLLWQAEFGVRGGDTEVPFALVWRKILTAPDSSSLSVYQRGDRMGYCEFSTSVGQQMAAVDTDKPPPEGLVRQAGYQIHLAGNVSFGDFTNRLKFEGNVQFSNPRNWRAINLRITAHGAIIEIRSEATNQLVHFKIISDGAILERDLKQQDLRNPNAILQTFVGGFAESMFGAFDLPELPAGGGEIPEWTANRTRFKVGSESVPVYALESTILGHKIKVIVSTLGEIIRVELPGDIVAKIDE